MTVYTSVNNAGVGGGGSGAPVPRYAGITIRTAGGGLVGTSQGPFTVAQYADWSGLSLAGAQAAIDQGVADGFLVASG